MTIPSNIGVNVKTYADAKLGALLNQNAFIRGANTKFKDFDKETKQLGDTISLELPPRSTVSNGLVASFQGANMRKIDLQCDQAANSAHAFTDQDFIFNFRDYMDKFGLARVQELGAAIEFSVAQNSHSAVPVQTLVNGQSVPTGALHTESGPFRFYGDGSTPINSFQQLALMEALFRNFGAAPGMLDVYLDDITPVSIIGNSLTQFVPNRNEKIANSWNLGSYNGSSANYYKSNMIPIHYSGTCGNSQDTLTLVSTNDATGQNITQLTFSGVTTNSGAIKSGDLIQFDASTDLYYLTWIGHKQSKNLVQVRATADADGTAGTVTVNITPPLRSAAGPDQNLNKALGAGATAKAVTTHRAGLVVGGKALYLAMPKLPSVSPFASATVTDKETGVSLRNYQGNKFGQNEMGLVTDCIWASLVVPEYSMRICLPV